MGYEYYTTEGNNEGGERVEEKKETGVTVAAASRFRKKFSGEFISTEFSIDVLKECTAEERERVKHG